MPCNNFAGYPGPLTADRAAELLAEDKAIEAALHVVDRALADSRLSIKPYLKVTAAASRPTCMALARGGGGTGPRRDLVHPLSESVQLRRQVAVRPLATAWPAAAAH